VLAASLNLLFDKYLEKLKWGICLLCGLERLLQLSWLGSYAWKWNSQGYARTRMMDRLDNRKHGRLGARFAISCHKVGSAARTPQGGHTVNVSPGGVYFETATDTFERGNLLRVELSIPPTSGLLQFGGKIAGFGRVLRAENIGASPAGGASPTSRYGVALQFCRPPRLCL